MVGLEVVRSWQGAQHSLLCSWVRKWSSRRYKWGIWGSLAMEKENWGKLIAFFNGKRRRGTSKRWGKHHQAAHRPYSCSVCSSKPICCRPYSLSTAKATKVNNWVAWNQGTEDADLKSNWLFTPGKCEKSAFPTNSIVSKDTVSNWHCAALAFSW